MGRKPKNTPVIENISEDRLSEFYDFRNRDKIVTFLNKNPFLLDILDEAVPQIRKYFFNSPLFLQFISEDGSEEYSYLAIFISTNLNAMAANERLNEFDQDWWMFNLARTQGKLTINLQFQ